MSLSLLLLTVFPLTLSAQSYRSTVEGTVIDRPGSKELLLLKATQDIRIHSTIVPIVDGKFSFTVEGDYPEAYELIFAEEHRQGSWMPVHFFPDKGEGNLHLTLYPSEQLAKNSFTGGEMQQQYLRLKDYRDSLYEAELIEADRKLDSLYDHDLAYTPEATKLLDKARNAPQEDRDSLWQVWYDLFSSGEHLTPEAAVLSSVMDSIHMVRRIAVYEYTFENPSIPGYYLLYMDMERERSPEETLLRARVYDKLASLYPDHP